MSTEKKKVISLNYSEGGLQPEMKPILLNYKKWKKDSSTKPDEGKPSYSRGLEDVQRMEGDAVLIAKKAAQALSKSLETYHEAREKSARKKKDGALEDFLDNSAKATSAYLKEASDIPVDLADSIGRSSLRKNLRKSLRRAGGFIGKWKI